MDIIDKLFDYLSKGKITSDNDFYKSISEDRDLLEAVVEFRFGDFSALKRSSWWEVYGLRTGYVAKNYVNGVGDWQYTRDEAIAKARELNKG